MLFRSVQGNSNLIMCGGVVSDNITEQNGGGIYVTTNSTLVMAGGKILGNTAVWGGGVYIYANTGTSFTMFGGEESRRQAFACLRHIKRSSASQKKVCEALFLII